MSAPNRRPGPPGRDCPPRMRDYETERATYRVDVPERFNAVLAIVDSWAALDRDAPAILSVDATGAQVTLQSFGDVARASRKAARALLELGVSKGDRVFVMLPRVAAWYAAMLGCMRIAAVPMPGPTLLTEKDIAYRLEQGRAVAAITDAAGSAKVDAASWDHSVRLSVGSAPDGWLNFEERCALAGDGDTPRDPTHRDDPLLLYFTSGTVAHPKMVEHAQSYALGHVATARFWHDLRPGDRHWTVTDTGWAKAAWGGLFGQLHERACIVQVALGRPNANTVLDIIARHGVTSFCAPPTLYRLLVQADFSAHDLSALRHCTSAGEPLNPEVIRAWRELTGGLTISRFGRARWAGPCRGGTSPWLTTTADHETGAVGNIAVRCRPERPIGLFQGYHGDPSVTSRAFRADFYFTGDRAALDEDGYLWFERRDDDVATSSAYRIGPFEVESALVEHPAVMEAAVIGREDPERTQIVVAVCILAPGNEPSAALARDVQEHVKRTTAPYKYPREIHFVSELPKTVSGKIRRSELRGWLLDGRLPAGGALR